MPDLSILIPARNELFLNRTVDDILANSEGDTEVLVGLDGDWPAVDITKDKRVMFIVRSESIGQRAMTNQLARLSSAKYLMKVDAHCAFDQGFDVKLMERMSDDVTMAPVMRNLHAFDWVCANGHRRYQGPSGSCMECGEPTERDVVWIAKPSPQSSAYCFDPTPHFQYFGELKKRQNGAELTETMSLQGSAFMLSRDKYWDLNICDESFGSWGSQGIEVAAKTWLSGGRVLVNHRTWYAHMFRTQGGDFGFPYPQSGKQVEKAKALARERFLEGTWGPKQVHPMSWLVEKFWPVPGWTQNDLASLKQAPTKGILYYTSNRLNMRIASKCRQQLAKAGLPVTSVSLKPMKFGRNIVLEGEPGVLQMFRQILAGLEAMTENIVYFAEHDVLYHPSHFDFTPPDPFKFYYASNYWFVRQDGFAVHYDVSPLSGLVGYREQLIEHFRERVAMIERDGFTLHMGYEPMTHHRVKWQRWFDFETFASEGPNVDLATGGNTSWKRWKQSQFIRKPKNWTEGTWEDIPGWGDVRAYL